MSPEEEGEDDSGLAAPEEATPRQIPLPGSFGEAAAPESMYLPIEQARVMGGMYIVFPEDPFRLGWDMFVLLIIFCMFEARFTALMRSVAGYAFANVLACPRF